MRSPASLIAAVCIASAGVLSLHPDRLESRVWSQEQKREAAPAPRPGGDAAIVALIHKRQEYLLGESILVHFQLKNVGKIPLPYEKGGYFPDWRINDGYEVTATPLDDAGRPAGKPLRPAERPGDFGGPEGNWKLAPGEVYEQTLYLTRYLRFEKPGKYLIRIVNRHRIDHRREYAAGETVLTLKLPTPEEARQVYEKIKELPAGPAAEIGQRVETEIADYEALIHPIYLPILSEAARRQETAALQGLGKMETAEATAALVSLLDHFAEKQDPAAELAAYRQLASRLPNPRYFAHEKTDASTHKYYAPQRDFVSRTWRPEFAPTLRRFASRLARAPGFDGLAELSFIYECVGTAEDLPDLARGYTKAIERTLTLPFETQQYFRPRGAAYGYQFSVRRLLERGARIPEAPATTGEAGVYLIALASKPDARPADWPAQVARWLQHDNPYLRELVLDSTPEPVPQPVLDALPKLLFHEYVDLQIAACHMARKHPQEACQPRLRTLLQVAQEENLLNAAARAALANGITNDQVMEIWLTRVRNDARNGRWVLRLLLSILDDNQMSSVPALDGEAREATLERWARFIEEHRAALKQGKRYKLGDAEITPDLFPPGFQFYRDGKPWPPR